MRILLPAADGERNESLWKLAFDIYISTNALRGSDTLERLKLCFIL